ncbi:MAG: hypothetical protein E5Y74_00110 [Mesorhizobium sp.]|nr:MAG: hypothetical protein E5Y74_00110 [Mesorhizobium sp.]
MADNYDLSFAGPAFSALLSKLPGAQTASPKFNINDRVSFTDQKGQKVTGMILEIVAFWFGKSDPVVKYLITHPDYRNAVHVDECKVEFMSGIYGDE